MLDHLFIHILHAALNYPGSSPFWYKSEGTLTIHDFAE